MSELQHAKLLLVWSAALDYIEILDGVHSGNRDEAAETLRARLRDTVSPENARCLVKDYAVLKAIDDRMREHADQAETFSADDF
jgi:hypothetical protein